ncbi:hypothetical protein KIN20_010409 [Parelaphostrongylus tenuis]|uniref:Uncharacterized protein n=1 Tax=Parelaphostrongylus tenuis TaxID=148309 RepID=A0AAD5MZ16_PARTN|nr:hypothetical protein KIN20_010409 [Parelaphostrongylus tenuis]
MVPVRENKQERLTTTKNTTSNSITPVSSCCKLIARATGYNTFTSKLTKHRRNAINEDLSERIAVTVETLKAGKSTQNTDICQSQNQNNCTQTSKRYSQSFQKDNEMRKTVQDALEGGEAVLNFSESSGLSRESTNLSEDSDRLVRIQFLSCFPPSSSRHSLAVAVLFNN